MASIILAWLTANWGYLAAAIVALDNVLAQIPSIKSNSTFQLITGLIPQAPKTPPAQ